MNPPEKPLIVGKKRTYELRQIFGMGLLQEGIKSVSIVPPSPASSRPGAPVLWESRRACWAGSERQGLDCNSPKRARAVHLARRWFSMIGRRIKKKTLPE